MVRACLAKSEPQRLNSIYRLHAIAKEGLQFRLHLNFASKRYQS